MKLILERKWPKDTYTVGRIYVGSSLYGNSLEDKDRGLVQADSLAKIKKVKVYGETAIPKGTYEIDMDTISWKYKAVKWYDELCGGKLPRLKNVPGFEGVLIHPGNTALDTNGCILIGKNSEVGKVTQSRDYFKKLYLKMKEAHDRGEKITITIK